MSRAPASPTAAIACPACGAPAAVDDRFCEVCGHALRDDGAVADGRVEVLDAGAAGVTHRGLLHARNEDAMRLSVRDRSASSPVTVAIVCDGVSSSIHPEIASRLAASTAASALTAVSAPDEQSVHDAIAAAQAAVERIPWSRDRDTSAPSCTLAAAVWDGEHVVVGNVGDSRVYWLGADGARVLTEDDSWMHHQLANGTDPRVARRDPNAHAITRWLGEDASDDPYRVSTFTPPGAGRVVVCSDGLWNYAAEPASLLELAGTQALAGTPAELAHHYVDAALAAGGHDNVTVVVVDVVPPGVTPPTSQEEAP